VFALGSTKTANTISSGDGWLRGVVECRHSTNTNFIIGGLQIPIPILVVVNPGSS
jgi:hypothetical protein